MLVSRASTLKGQDTHGIGQLTTNDLDLNEEQMEKFVKTGIKKPYISVRPKKQQLYFLYKLIMNRKLFQFNFIDRRLHSIRKIFCCCRKKLMKKWCAKRFKSTEKKTRLFKTGQRKLTQDLDIISLIERQ